MRCLAWSISTLRDGSRRGRRSRCTPRPGVRHRRGPRTPPARRGRAAASSAAPPPRRTRRGPWPSICSPAPSKSGRSRPSCRCVVLPWWSRSRSACTRSRWRAASRADPCSSPALARSGCSPPPARSPREPARCGAPMFGRARSPAPVRSASPRPWTSPQWCCPSRGSTSSSSARDCPGRFTRCCAPARAAALSCRSATSPTSRNRSTSRRSSARRSSCVAPSATTARSTRRSPCSPPRRRSNA